MMVQAYGEEEEEEWEGQGEGPDREHGAAEGEEMPSYSEVGVESLSVWR